MFQATQRSSYEQLRDQISQRAKGRSAVDFYEEGMTSLLSYMFFVLHYHENYLTLKTCISGPLSRIAKSAIILIALCFPGSFHCRCRKSSRMMSRKLDRPFLPVIRIGQREIVTLPRSVIASKIPCREIFQHDAKAFAVPPEAMHVRELPVEHMPGPEPQANCFYCWGHGTTYPCTMTFFRSTAKPHRTCIISRPCWISFPNSIMAQKTVQE